MENAQESGFNRAVKAGFTPQFLLTLFIAAGGALSTYAVLGYRVATLEKDREESEADFKLMRDALSKQNLSFVGYDRDAMRLQEKVTEIGRQQEKLEMKIDRIADAVGVKKL